MFIKLNKGLDLPISGEPEQCVYAATAVRHIAVAGVDYIDLKPTMKVAEGDRVRLGQPLFEYKKLPGVVFTAPGAGRIVAINRGTRRILLSVVLQLDEQEDEETFIKYAPDELSNLTDEQVKENLLISGLWMALRTRPYSKVPDPATRPAAIFITAIDSNPLAADPVPIITAEMESFNHGLRILSRLTDGPLWVCQSPQAKLSLPEDLPQLQQARFAGPHPVGLPGTHIHFLQPVSAYKTVWYLNYQEVIAIGKLFVTGRLWTERIVALGGPGVKKPRLLRTRLGASLEELLAGELVESMDKRVISGSVWSGRKAVDELAFLGRHHLQVTVIGEKSEREFLGWLNPGGNKYSKLNVLFSSFFRKKRKFEFTASQQGSPRAMIPIDIFEEVMPLDILPAQLLRALLVMDTDMAQKLGCLELDEEDLALCSFICVGKHDYGVILRENLRQIEKEG